jgi:sulfide dehydrogenase [flavocytochrome c] flavoprotein subunit
MTLDRRSFLKLVSAGAGAAGLPMIGRAAELMPKGAKRVVVVGGGYGGTIAAKYIRMMDKSIEVVMIERNDHFVSCPFSNLYIGGILKDLNPLTIKYDKLARITASRSSRRKSRPSTPRPRW